MKWKSHEDTKYDLYRYGFVPNYYVWIAHGERLSQGPSQQIPNPFNEQDKEKFGGEESLDAESRNVCNTYSRCVELVGIKDGRAYASVLDEYMLQNVNMDEPSVHDVPNDELDDLRETVKKQKLEQALLRAELDNLSSTQKHLSRKLDQVVESQTSFELNLRTIVSQEVSKAVAHEIEKATRQILDVIRVR